MIDNKYWIWGLVFIAFFLMISSINIASSIEELSNTDYESCLDFCRYSISGNDLKLDCISECNSQIKLNQEKVKE